AAARAGSAAPSGHAQGNAQPRGDTALRGKDATTNLEQGFLDLDSSRYAEAEAIFRANLAKGIPRSRLGLARVLIETGRYGEAAAVSAESAGAPAAIALELVAQRGEALRRL